MKPDFIDIAPECFTDGDELVISYKGENYYRACGYPVNSAPQGGSSHCVKRVNHPSKQHEDYDGRTRERVDGDGKTVASPTPLKLVEDGA